ncbi:MAG: type IX secretion system sortase PorU [Algoriphagus sp.]|uniref:type IX secretion system sortase PorU n=1 Tax=Algoriphagus sp. TaxID=1872435 RepID=UPI0017CB84E7|nr:type IX secretion system sortase PorU [Algoriphagus sp.]NVJ85149.1 type IX secretion system sortase PorU [Algoriphagus sp.]
MRNAFIVNLGIVFLSLFANQTWAQSDIFKFPVLESGIYQLTPEQLSTLGISDISEVTFYGFPGRLPQKLDSSQLDLKEIPALETSEGLFVFLSGPHVIESDENSISYRHHYYTDTLYYLIGRKKDPKRIQTVKLSEGNSENPPTLYQWTAIKGEDSNLLNSGRVWYSKPVSSGNIQSIPIRKNSSTNAPWKIQGVVMGQSIQGGQIHLIENGNEITNVTIPPIPNSTYGIKGIEVPIQEEFIPTTSSISTIEIGFESADPNGTGYFEHLLVGVPFSSENIEPGIYFPESTLPFSNSCSTCQVWEVSDFFNPLDLGNQNLVAGSQLIFFNEESIQQIEEIKAVETTIRSIGNWPELLILTSEDFLPEANKLATHKLSQGIFAEAISIESVYDQFGFGNPDLIAIRNFVAWHFHSGKRLTNLLFLGKGTFDYKGKLGGRPSIVPTYSSRNSLNPLTTFSSDDFFGLLEFGQGEWVESQEGDEMLSIGVGRLPVINRREAELVVNKLIDYESTPSFGKWKRNFTLFADDGDNNIHLRDAESHATTLGEKAQAYFQEKLYLDRFEQIEENGNQRSPKAKEKLLHNLEEGTLFMNFIGHGNETTLTAEEVFRIEDIQNWPNFKNPALWVTATCEFGRYDSPFIRSAAEELLIAEGKGAIGLLTTGRPVFSSVNFRLNQAFIQEVFRKLDGKHQDLGSIFKNTKNASLNGPLNRNFSLLGDPSMKLDYPDFDIRAIEFKNESGEPIESFSPLSEITFSAEIIEPESGSRISNFNGSFEVELQDKPTFIETLGDESSPVEFPEENTILFKGSGEVINGLFEGKLRVPAGISPDLEKGQFRFYAVDSIQSLDAIGGLQVLIGGEPNEEPNDQEGPEIQFKIENLTAAPLIFPKNQLEAQFQFSDPNGIDVSGLILENNLTIRINNQEEEVLNHEFVSLESSYQKGKVDLTLAGLREGLNLIEIKAADLLGNISVKTIEIEVRGSNEIQILNNKIYPNPANEKTTFQVTHNRPGENLVITLEVFDLAGNILFSDSRRWVKVDSKIEPFTWIFLQSQSKIPAKGTYIYKLTLQSEEDNTLDSISGKLIIE